jgi:hypothetical protein
MSNNNNNNNNNNSPWVAGVFFPQFLWYRNLANLSKNLAKLVKSTLEFF